MKTAATYLHWVINVAAVLIIALSVPKILTIAAQGHGLISSHHLDIGHALLTSVHDPLLDPCWRMPAGPLFETWMLLSPKHVAQVIIAVTLFISLLLCGAISIGVGGNPLIATAAWSIILSNIPINPGFLKMLLYGIFLQVVTLALIQRTLTPGNTSDWKVGIGFAASLVMRSVLFPLLAIISIKKLLSRNPRVLIRLLLPAFILLLPWGYLNKRHHNSWTLIEHGSADLILIGGTVGMIDTTPEGDAMKLIHPDTRTQPTTLWVLKQYLSTPTQAITNFFKRLRYVIGLNYLLFTLALLGFYARRKEKSTHCLALVSLYFICLHCLFATLAYLYEPLWPLLCAMSSLVVAHPKSRSNLWQSISRKILNLSLSALIIGALYCQYIVIRYTVNSTQRAPESEEALNHALQRMPKDPLLLLEKARSQIAQGKIEQAQITIDQIAPGTPPLPRIELERNRIAFHRGEINVISPPIQQPAFDDDVTIRFLLYRALEASNDDTALATKTITQACQYWNKQQRLTEVRDSQEEDWQKHLRQNSDNALAQYATSIFYRMPIHRWLKPLAIAAAVGSVSFSKELALILQSNGYPHDACTLIQEILLSNSTNPELWRDLGVCHYLDNNLKQAFAALQKSYALDSRSPATVLSLGSVMTQMGQSKSALNLYKESLSQRPKHSEGPLWVLIEDNLRKNTH